MATISKNNIRFFYSETVDPNGKKNQKLGLEWSMSDQLSKLCQTALFSIQDGHYINRNYFNWLFSVPSTALISSSTSIQLGSKDRVGNFKLKIN